MAFTIERIKSFLAKRRLPQFGQEANKDTYSVSLLLFQLCEHDKHFIFHLLFDPEAFHKLIEGVRRNYLFIANCLFFCTRYCLNPRNSRTSH